MNNAKLSRGQVDRAGATLRTDSSTSADRTAARAIVGDWRAQHRVPLVAIRMLLHQRTHRVSAGGWISQRLKRLPSMELKLRRFSKMKLTQMQDIGGCRAVVPSVSEVEALHRLCLDGKQAHELSRTKDYLAGPKADGYRSAHLVYRYKSRSEKNSAWNGREIEIQIRSRLQHAWATALETVDVLQKTGLKVGGCGNRDWKRFFALMGTVHAIEERRAPVPGTPTTLTEIRPEVRQLAKRLGAGNVLGGLVPATASLVKGKGWALLSLDADARKIRVQRYSSIDLAQQEYLRLEEENADNISVQVCLVSTDSAETLRRAYPNYFLDVRPFVDSLRSFLGSAPRSN